MALSALSALAQPPSEIVESISGRRFYATGEAHLDTALTYVGAVERPPRSNRGREVDRFTRIGARLNPPIFWCAAFTSYCRLAAAEATGQTTGPYERSGRPHYGAGATKHLSFGRYIRARDVRRGAVSVPVGSIVVWRSGNSWRGHIGFVWRDDDPTDEGFAANDYSTEALAWRHACGRTVEGNTSSGRRGSQRDGGGVYTRTRCISHSHFRIVGFVPPR